MVRCASYGLSYYQRHKATDLSCSANIFHEVGCSQVRQAPPESAADEVEKRCLRRHAGDYVRCGLRGREVLLDWENERTREDETYAMPSSC